MLQNTDQLGRVLQFEKIPKRVISLVPSITEYLVDMGVEVIGRTKFCIHPKERIQSIPIVGGTKNFRFDTIHQLQPDLIIGNKEENYQEGIDLLAEKFPVWMSDIYTIEDALEMINGTSLLLDKVEKGKKIIASLSKKLNELSNTKTGSVLYLIWREPWMAAGTKTYIDSFLAHLGYQNVVKVERYPGFTLEQIQALNPDTLLLSSEPFPFKQKHIEEIRAAFSHTDIRIVNGEFYSWYGTRLLKLKDDYWMGE